jgi:hypothetical protein
MGQWLAFADRTIAILFPKTRGLHRDPPASAWNPGTSSGFRPYPFDPEVVLVGISTAGPRFF